MLLLQLQHFLMLHLSFFVQFDHKLKIIINLLRQMIGSDKVRPSMQITLADIFQDYNDPRKDMLAKRVSLVLQDQEKRLMSQLDSVNLTNLQKMLKKDHHLKTAQQKLKVKEQEMEDIRIQLTYFKGKVQQLQVQLEKYSEMLKSSDQRFSKMIDSVRKLEEVIQDKANKHLDLQRQKKSLIEQNMKLEEEKDRFERMIFSLKQNYSQKIEATEFSIKIKEQNLNEQFNQNLKSLKTIQIIQNQQNEVKEKLRTIIGFKNQKIQCDLLRQCSPIPSGRQSVRLSHRSPRKNIKVQKQQIAVQTQQTKQRQLTQIIQQHESRAVQNENLDQIRLIYTNTPRSIPLPQPKLTKYTTSSWQNRQIQTTPLIPKVQFSKQIQVLVQTKSHLVEKELVDLKIKYQTSKIKAENQMKDLFTKYTIALKECEKIEDLQLKNKAMQLLIDEKNTQLIRQRDVLARTHQQLINLQNEYIIYKLRDNPPSVSARKPKFSNTNSLFFSGTKNKSSFNETPSRILTIDHDYPRKESQSYLSPRKWDQQESDLITIIKQANKIKSYKVRQRATTQSNPSATTPVSGLVIKRSYAKYSVSKRK